MPTLSFAIVCASTGWFIGNGPLAAPRYQPRDAVESTAILEYGKRLSLVPGTQPSVLLKSDHERSNIEPESLWCDDRSSALMNGERSGVDKLDSQPLEAQRVRKRARIRKLSKESEEDLKGFMLDYAISQNLSGFERDMALKVLPRLSDLRSQGRFDLVKAIQQAGGSCVVAAELGLFLSARAVTSFKDDQALLIRAIAEFVRERGREGLFPRTDDLRSAGRLDIIAGIRNNGGATKIAEAMGLKMQRGRRPISRQESLAWLQHQFADNGLLPTNQELIANGRIDVLRHIIACGGRHEVSKKLSLPVADGTILSEDLFSHDVCTSSVALEYNSLEALSREEIRGGGGGAVLDTDGGRRRRHHLFLDFDALKDELMCFIFDSGHVGVMPTARQLIRARRRDLVRGMALHGGQKVVADKLGLMRQSLSREQVLRRAKLLRGQPSFQRPSV